MNEATTTGASTDARGETVRGQMGDMLDRAKAAPMQVSPLLAALRTRTKDLHTQAEKHPVQAAMVRGQSGVEGYVAYLGQMWHIHSALERELAARLGSTTLTPVTREQFRADRIVEDIASFEGAQVAPPVAPVADFAGNVADMSDEELLGLHYVLEGSTNGGRFIAMAIRKGLRLEGESGTRYLDPYADAQKAKWGAFCTAMNALDFDDAQTDRTVRGAERMFRLIIETFDAMSDTNNAVTPNDSTA